MMKLAWLCWKWEPFEEEGPIILFEKPEDYRFHKIVCIVYAEVKE